MNTRLVDHVRLLNLLQSGEQCGMEDTEFLRRYIPAEIISKGWDAFERWTEAHKVQWELFQIDPVNDPAAVGIAFGPAEQ